MLGLGQHVKYKSYRRVELSCDENGELVREL